MPTNPYINNFGSSPEQSLVQDLVIESIKFYGIDVNWIPRITSANADSILNEDVNESYSYGATLGTHWGFNRALSLLRMDFQVSKTISLDENVVPSSWGFQTNLSLIFLF